MNVHIVLNFIGYILRLEGVTMLPCIGIALYKGETEAMWAFAATVVLLLAASVALLHKKAKSKAIFVKEGFLIVSLSWIMISFFGALPFFMSGAIPNFFDCIFETVSGFTTTGASILTDVEALPMSILYWRSFTHWLGGMGVLVLILSFVPLTKGSGDSFHILQAETTGPNIGKLAPKMHHTVIILYSIYMVMTILEVVLLAAGGMPLFDSICNAFATAGTGGFAIKNASIAAYDSFYLQGVISVFMMLFGVNFTVFSMIVIGKVSKALRNEELRVYLGILFTSVVVITINVLPLFDSAFEAVHHSFFQVSSVMTTTGFCTTDYNMWPQLSKFVLFFLMFVGASAGSTGGGIKVSRCLILFKSIKNGLLKQLHPRSVKTIQMDGREMDEGIVRNVNVFFVTYIIICMVSMLLISLENFSFETT